MSPNIRWWTCKYSFTFKWQWGGKEQNHNGRGMDPCCTISQLTYQRWDDKSVWTATVRTIKQKKHFYSSASAAVINHPWLMISHGLWCWRWWWQAFPRSSFKQGNFKEKFPEEWVLSTWAEECTSAVWRLLLHSRDILSLSSLPSSLSLIISWKKNMFA